MSLRGLQQFALRSFCQDFNNATLCDHRGQILFMKNPEVFDCGTWGEAFRTAIKYFSLNVGDVLVFNDPLNGGNDPSIFSFITCLQKNQDQQPGLYLGHRVATELSLKEILTGSKNVFHVPMTPVAQGGEIQTSFIEAMSAHPLAPKNLKELLSKEISAALSLKNRLRFLQSLTTKNLQAYLDETHEVGLKHLREKPWGETKLEMTLDTGESIKLFFEINETGVLLDFSGTGQGKDFFLPPGALAGSCAFFLAHYFGLENYLNQGVFSLFQVRQPTHSCLSAKPTQATRRAYKMGGRILHTLLDLALGKLHTKPARALTNFCGLYGELHFPETTLKPLQMFLPHGLGATGDTEGLSGADPFHETSFLPAEYVENTWPLRVLRMDLRNHSLGKGRVNGGRGLILELLSLGKAEFFWLTELTHFRFPVQKFQTSMDRIELNFGSQEEPKLTGSGRQTISSGERLTLTSGSGGGII